MGVPDQGAVATTGVGHRRREVAQMRRVGEVALARFGLDQPALRLLQHEHNTTYRVDAAGSAFVLRIHRPDGNGPETIGSELAWLRALATDTDLGVPEPVVAADGSPLVRVPVPSETEPLTAVLFRWQAGRFVDERLTPRHLRRVAELQAGLQHHAADWERPEGFSRPRVDTLTSAAKRHSIAPSGECRGPQPTTSDADACLALVDELLGTREAAVVERALEVVRATTGEVARDAAATGLIHADLHYENFLFHDGRARAIDFDDCGWGLYLYDLAATLWELEDRAHFAEMRDAVLEVHAGHHPLPADHLRHLSALFLLRRVQILMWILESRHHPAFADWDPSARADVRDLDAAGRRFG